MSELAKFIEHTYLQPDTNLLDVHRICEEALRSNFAVVCVPPFFVREARKIIGDRPKIRLGTVVGFPMGYSAISAKSDEIKRAMDEGADDIDAVINLAAIKSNMWNHLQRDTDALVLATQSRGGQLKLILECGLLSDDELKKSSQIAKEAGVPWLSSGTGWFGHPATSAMVERMIAASGNSFKYKAVTDKIDIMLAESLVQAGAHRIGTSQSLNLTK
ncbi:MAG: deoxyribose-phosphate aldolase [Saprospiraceae bacterium]|nr:deoxyribose-phosphate aldolase [Saprospiraceae bacterium]